MDDQDFKGIGIQPEEARKILGKIFHQLDIKKPLEGLSLETTIGPKARPDGILLDSLDVVAAETVVDQLYDINHMKGCEFTQCNTLGDVLSYLAGKIPQIAYRPA